MAIHNLPFVISNCSNNYGPNQFPEKLLPLFINNIRQGKKVLFTVMVILLETKLLLKIMQKLLIKFIIMVKKEKHIILEALTPWKNIDLIKVLCKQMDIALNKDQGSLNH